MKSRWLAVLALGLATAAPVLAAPKTDRPAPGKADAKAAAENPDDSKAISEGEEAVLVDYLKAERPALILFYRPDRPDDADLLKQVRARTEGDPRLALRLVRLKSLEAPIAKQYEVTATPLGFVYDRNKNLLGKGSSLDELTPLVGKAVRTARIKWVDERDPNAKDVYKMFGGGERPVPEIMKTMSLHPEVMEAFMQLSGKYHFADGYLIRRDHEMIASYVSALNKCKY